MLSMNHEAVVVYDKAILLNGDFTEAWLYRGISRASLGQYDLALGDYDHALALHAAYAAPISSGELP